MTKPETRNEKQPETRNQKLETILCFDFGKKRIGVAVGESQLKIAHPLTTLHAKDTISCLRAIEKLIAEWQPDLLIVGEAKYLDGTEHAMTKECHRFAQQLKKKFGILTKLYDERLSSFAAQESLHEIGVNSRKSKKVIDQVAAQIILQNYFDE